MNNIYKVIWSKAKNCYVVASEIARSHTKSASGSEKIGGVARHALLALGAACAIACGGFVNVGADERVEVTTTGGSNAIVYTKDGTESYVETKLDQKLQHELSFYAKFSDTYTKSDVDAKLEALTTTGEVATNKDNITTLKGKTVGLSTDGKSLNGMNSVETDALKVTGEISNGAGVTTTLADIKDSMDRTDMNKTWIGKLNAKTTNITHDATGTSVDGVTFNAGAVTGVTSINGTKIGVPESGEYISQDGSIWGNMKKVDTQVKTNADAIGNNTTAIAELGTKVGTVGTGTYLDPTKSVGDNLGFLDAGLKQEVADRKAAIGELAVNGNYIEKDKNVSDNLVKLDNQAKANADEIVKTNERTGGIKRNTEKTQTTIEDSVKVDKQGNVKDVKGLSAETITTTGNATIGGDLKVAGTITTDKMVFGDKATNNYTEIDHGKVTSKNLEVNGAGETISSSSTFNAKENKVGFANSVTGEQSLHKQTSDVITDNVKNNITGDQSFHKQTSDIIMDNVKDLHNSNNRTQTKTETKDIITDENGNSSTTSQTASENNTYLKDKDGKNTNSTIDTAKGYDKTIKGENGKTSTKQDELNITNTAKDGTIKNDAKDIVNNATGNMTNTVGGDLKTTVGGNELHEVTGTKTENVTGKVTENYGNGQETNVTGDQYLHVTGKQTNKIDRDQENIIGGNQTTTVTGDISNKAKNITNEASDSITDKVGDHTRVLDGDGITDTVGGSTFKQRIDKIMMESKDVSIKAEETLTNEAKVITNKASEVINNEAVNINNTATGIITSKASEIKNQADKLISNKVGENTWENMENGKITTSIKDGAKQNLTQSDAAGTTQSTVDGGKSTVTIQNADGLTDAVTDGRNTSVQNQTASAIAADVKDGAGNENASVATATTSANTIKNGTKANTVISTADGTSFINSEAAAPVTGASGAGTAVNTTIKGNTITTGKVTMDYAEVMNDLGVHGSATVDNDLTVKGITTTKTLKVTENATVGGTLDVTKKATFHDDVDIAKNLSVGGNATIAGDVTAKSYKVGRNTYIDENGINANNQKITNVADGSISEGSKDAVNGGQLYGVKRDLEHQVDKVGANAAAMANLRPMEFDPSSKWNIAAAIGNYGSETAAALGAFYRPNDNVMVNLSTAFGTGENMVGGGVSVRLGKGGNKLSREETNALKAQVADLTARMDALLPVLNPNMSKDFPDVPENHWAYEAVSRLAGNDIVQGYPDGEFHGERTMTRYEMAEIIYNALSRGAEAERELVEEFKPELQAMAASEKATTEKAEG